MLLLDEANSCDCIKLNGEYAVRSVACTCERADAHLHNQSQPCDISCMIRSPGALGGVTLRPALIIPDTGFTSLYNKNYYTSINILNIMD